MPTTTTTPKPTTTTTTTTPKPTTTTQAPLSLRDTLAKEGCHKSEIVFLLEHLRSDSRADLDHQADLVKHLVDGWRIDDNHVRVGVVTYSNEIKEIIHLDDYSGDKDAMKSKLNDLAEESE